ncbi:MAG: HD domain-containing protein [Lactobacillales bacterium]|jgi:putative nucleotidyltransferase with HDIG domain|nr:HD domain-containing protein [Lactobacillales bacterium]
MRKARQTFEKYIQNYNPSNPKINLKIIHTYEVVSVAEYIAQAQNLNEEDFCLAQIISLLHDIGRFEQLTRHNSFADSICNHAELGVEVLLENNFIDEFGVPKHLQDIVIYAIKNHNKYKIEPAPTPRHELHVNIVRDADKLDNYRVKTTEAFETMFDISYVEFRKENITSKIYDDFSNHKLIFHPDRKTHLDMWLSYIAFIFDLNFKASYAWIEENDYINRVMSRVSLAQENEEKKYRELQKKAQDFVSQNAQGVV